MKKSNLLFLLVLTILGFLCFSCQNDLLPSPKNEISADLNQNVPETTIGEVPENLVASHGLKGKIELSWKGVKNVSRYYIYESETPYDNFIQVAETQNNSTNYTLDEKAGTSKYYKVTAVDRNDEESAFSIAAHGTTLANPVITYIAQDEENSDSASLVHWYMNNCNTNTYQKNVRYTITCFDPQGNNIAEKIHDGQNDYPSIVFEDLTPNTNYTYQVTAYIVSNQNDTEISDKVDAATARRLRPNPPENLFATLGTSPSEIELTFDLPAMVDVALGSGIYEPKPLYFKIYRRIMSENATEADWQIIESKFATQEFSSQYIPSNPEQLYEPGMTVTYTDTNDLKRGLMYEYKVQSYADETTREISSNQSFATTNGFLMAVPKFETTDYEAILNEEETLYTNISTGFNFEWNMLGYEKDYGFILGEKRYKLEEDNQGIKDEIGELETFRYFETIEAVNEYCKDFDLTDENVLNEVRGYYTYKLYIIEKPEENYVVPAEGETFDFVVELNAFGTILVTQDTTKPEIKNFSTQDGYKNKVCLSWEYDETISKYTIIYETEDGTESTIEDFSSLFENAKNGDIVTYEHFVESGFSAKYTLVALRGISVYTDPVELYTLGTPELNFDAENLQYDTISVKWNPVSKADTYELSYSIDGSSYSEPAIISVPQENVENPENFVVNTDGSYTYNFVQPEKYDDATFAGKDIFVKIQAKNTFDATNDNITTKLLGPVNINATSKAAEYTDKIIVKWRPVQGAKKYLVKRDRYSVDNKTVESTDFYYVNTDGSSISVQDEESVTAKQVEIVLSADINNNSQFVLTDKAYENADGTKWKKNQDKINWGFPYHYTVFPLANENDTFDEETGTLAEKVAYKNLSKIEATGSALGYGHNVTATKSEDPNDITITWDKPHLNTTKNYTPILWRSESGKNKWERANVSLDSTGSKFVFTPKYNSVTQVNERITPYDFAIMYEDTSTKPNQNYLDDLATKLDEYNEPTNKGYAFAIATKLENVPVDGKTGYQERISWTPWDYTKRARGPKEDAVYTVQMQNNNLGSDWKTVATYKNDGTISINNPAAYETSITVQGNGIVITPNGLSTSNSAIHNGLLKVLRDYKHYAKVVVTRETSAGEITASFADDEDMNYAIRKITEGELCNNVALIVADALYKSGIPYKTVSGSNSKSTSGANGTFKITCSPNGLFDYTNKVSWGFNETDYIHKFSNGFSSSNTKEQRSAFTLSSKQSSSVLGSDQNKLFYLPSLSITVKHESNEPSYEGTVSISVGAEGKSTSYSLTYKKDNNVIISLSNTSQENFYKYFPYDIGSERENGNSSLDTGLKIYQSPWWN